MQRQPFLFFFFLMIIAVCQQSCQPAANSNLKETNDSAVVKLITLDPGHFHAALVQKSMYPEIDSTVYVYAPGGAELQAHLALIKQYNERQDNPTHWNEQVYTSSDFLNKMLNEKKGNVVVLAGNNQRKTECISKVVNAGLNVLGDKPMAINSSNFAMLENAFRTAAKNGVLLYDIMTERSEITNILQKELAHTPAVFGTLAAGTQNNPAVVIESVHYFYKYVSGNVLTRPDWFFDPGQQGEAIADVGTHLIDLVQWSLFPDTAIDYKKDIVIKAARIWPTPVTLLQFAAVTKETAFPSFLQPYVTHDTVLQTHANGEINYTLKGVPVKLTARWNYQAPEGSGDTHYCLLKGTKANLEIRQGKEENYKPTLYIIQKSSGSGYENEVQDAVKQLSTKYPGISLQKNKQGWLVIIPEKYKVGHEAHFAQVMQRYLQYFKERKLPDWEVPDMIAKYYTSTKALEIATKKAHN
ncbi:oxidoreductase [Ilyomonas limi]|uniref:Oxidoreductase n=1 Tax=Ilyomonas limi TaxID=2575867 RepID=A0A4U3L9A3_9BACT|nr:putative oxidoreductase C-terminal domain-containing protein [Ilyomonas limi]TKK71901.1 oxidoreductase [Ilyomonas limi]